MTTIIVAAAENGAIGLENKLLYHIRADLQRFKTLTQGHTVIMGRKTFLSLPKGALPNRRNMVLSRNKGVNFPGTECFTSLAEALMACPPEEKVFIIGGEQVYREALSLADTIELTLIHATPPKADAFFPLPSPGEWRITASESFPSDGPDGTPPYSFITYRRV